VAIESLPPGTISDKDTNDMAASFQAAVVDSIGDRVRHALEMFGATSDGRTLVVAGGVAANTALRAELEKRARTAGFTFIAPPLALCTDNAVMIAWAALERFKSGMTDGLDFKARPRWPLDPTAPPARGAGVKA
jgi:N6-L-threonylcarbamoyladenine synthase